ncbi:hypothetical protein [Clostridium magnum]|uniref:Uncharacterized protein n=1 Tax=Clostridium magnum DSM 2767 TaxID=1121326 RepID=A0A162QX09_9CLOT|nr:hypothetical protein [Clostridium magnum]KZL89087.1 hypothetical protein CLMAG_55730 [Clostridium magnum DSM 2767]SHI29461.1 hypothetical protein SAMN02745944_04059 [Clostridium magnum DSM 2767]
MLSKTSIIKYSIVLIAITAGLFFSLSGHAPSKTMSASKSADTASVEVNGPVSKTRSSDNSNNTASATVQANAAVSKAEVQAAAVKSELNNYVLKVIPAYKGGKYPYLLNSDYNHYNGVTENIIYQGSVIAKANPDGSKSSHCVGLTYEVFFKAMEERNKEAGISPGNFNNMTINNMKDFMLTWYNAKGTPKSAGDQLAGAIVKYGLGSQIKRLEDAKEGDFIDFSRTKSGHTAVFINWLKDDKGNIVGFKYWSTQESTNGIAYKEEYFSDNPQGTFKGTVNRNQLYIGRVGPIVDYRSF